MSVAPNPTHSLGRSVDSASRPFSDYATVTAYLYAQKARGPKFGVERMRGLAAALGHPERSYPVIHVAGTNGKGSVSAMLDAIFQAAGWRTGLFTSPHLVQLGERVQVNRQILTAEAMIAYTNEVRATCAAAGVAADAEDYPTFFEFMTAMAFLQFKRQCVDLATIEVGMGGRLDATNVVDPLVTVITSIGLDHCVELGATFEEIAREKAGIIKLGRPIVLGRVPLAAEQIIRAIAAERGAVVHSVREIYGEDLGCYPQTNLAGDYQRWNAATATLVAQVMPKEWRLTAPVIAQGLTQVNWPGRWESIKLEDRLLILDASHNPEGVAVLAENLQQLIATTGRRPLIVAGALGEFRARAMLEVLLRYAQEIYLVTPRQERACPGEVMRAFVPAAERHRVHVTSLDKIFPEPGACVIGNSTDPVVVTGSIYVLGEVMERLALKRALPASGEDRG
ncbi:MAG: bifunctional folylpolyglutamate synthase/dihydrofolate synthase [Opitutaceae bacterium]|nr:bifunctional folylpolyglutamate synthase/dihydrofolate synthase [Opitutaceae bacterium]